MEWKEKAINQYPKIILSDCVVSDIEINQRDIAINFNEFGFAIKENGASKYYRTEASQIVLQNCDLSNIIVKKRKYIDDKSDLVHDIKPDVFYHNISLSEWRYEIVEEFYSDRGGFFIGKVKKDNNSFWCYIKLYFENIIYLWNDINYSYVLN